MTSVVSFVAPRTATLVEEEPAPLTGTDVRVRTELSGISAGTELTAYRGLNPYLHRRWDPELRLFLPGSRTMSFPVVGWGYEEVGVVTEVGVDVADLHPGDRVWGSWGHREETVLPASVAAPRVLEPTADPRAGVFAKIGAIALNAVLDARLHPGETLVVLGLGVPGQLAASLARRAGARVVGVDLHASRRELATRRGVDVVIDPADGDVAATVRELTGGRGADVAIELAGAGPAIHEAIRCVAYNSRVVVAGFHQGDATGVRLGEEFHHNRITLVSSQISGTAVDLQHRWDELRLATTVVDLAVRGELDVVDLISHSYPPTEVAEAFRLLDSGSEDALQVVLDFRG